MGVPDHSVLWGDYIQPDTPAATALLIRTACQDIPWIPNHLGPPAQLNFLPNPPDVTICDSRPRNLQAVHPCPPHNTILLSLWQTAMAFWRACRSEINPLVESGSRFTCQRTIDVYGIIQREDTYGRDVGQPMACHSTWTCAWNMYDG